MIKRKRLQDPNKPYYLDRFSTFKEIRDYIEINTGYHIRDWGVVSYASSNFDSGKVLYVQIANSEIPTVSLVRIALEAIGLYVYPMEGRSSDGLTMFYMDQLYDKRR